MLLRGQEGPAAAGLGASVCRTLLVVSLRTGLDLDAAHRVFEEGLRCAEATGDPIRVGLMHQAISVHENQNLRIDAALEHAVAFERVMRAGPDPELRSMAFWPSLGPLRLRGDLAECRARAAEQIEWSRDHPEWGLRDWGFSVHVGALLELGFASTYDGPLDRARAHLERGIEVARSVGDREFEASCLGGLAHLACRAGEPEKGIAPAQRYVESAERLASAFRINAYVALGEVLLLTGRTAEALDAIEQGESLRVLGEMMRLPLLRIRARARLANGEVEAACADAEHVFAHALEVGARIEAVEAAITLSAVLGARGDPAEANRIAEVLAIADRLIGETGARNLAPFVLLERAALRTQSNGAAQRRALLERARDAFLEMGATGRARAVEAQLDT